MGEINIAHWLVTILVAAIFIVPSARILRRVGLSPWWSIIAVIPLVNVFGLWLLAFANWPAEKS